MSKNERHLMTEKDTDKVTIGIVSIIVVAVGFAEIMSYVKTGIFDQDLLSPTLGLVCWFCLYLNSQRIIDNNLFKKIIVISIGIIFICFLKQAFTQYFYGSLASAAIPLIYSIYFRILVALFYKNYPIQKPTVIFTSKFGSADYKGKDDGYKLTVKDRLFSLLLFIGFILFCLGFIIGLKKLNLL